MDDYYMSDAESDHYYSMSDADPITFSDSESQSRDNMEYVLSPEEIIPSLQAGLQITHPAEFPSSPMRTKMVLRSSGILDKVRHDTFPFFMLPLELRNMVYTYLFDGYAFMFRHVNVMVAAINLPDLMEEFPCQKNLPPWITLNKQFCFESLRQFHATAFFSFPYGCDLPLSSTPSAPASLLRLDRARRVVLTPDEPCAFHWDKLEVADGYKVYNIRLSPDCVALHRQTMNHLKCSGSCDMPPTRALKTILLEFELDIPSKLDFSIRHVRTNEISMGLLNQYPKDIHKLKGLQQVIIMLNYNWRVAQDVYEKAKAAVKREMRLIAEMLIETPGADFDEQVVPLGIPGAAVACWRLVATSRVYRLSQKADK